jgi:uncharacterized membrane protein YraQ (UPF0718 family)
VSSGTIIKRGSVQPVIFSIIVMIALASLFWTQSRYPSLDEKAMMSGSIQLEDPLSFEALIPITADMTLPHRVGISTVNWINTNKKGMTFGLLFGASFLTLLGYLRRRSFSGPLANSLYGMFLGAPLGVCVNCAAPIAKGLYQGGSRAETTLSAMIASPTLNIIVMTMAFSLLPFYIAVTKLVLSLIVVLVAVPIICRFIPQDRLLRSVDQGQITPVSPMVEAEDDPSVPTSLQASFQIYLGDFGKNLWFILRTTLPLMMLAGFLGALTATLMPAGMIAEWEFGWLNAAMAAVMGTFLPVPIGFDVVLSGAMLNGGASHGFIMTLVFTLGSFSIYSFFVVGTSVGWRAAGLLGATVIVLGMVAGLGASAWHGYQTERALEQLTSQMEAGEAMLAAVPDLGAQGRLVAPAADRSGDFVVSVEATPFGAPVSYGDMPFTRVEAWTLGIDHPVEFSFADMWPPFWEGRSLSSGDIDRDGDVDLVYASTRRGLYIYENDGAGQFVARDLDLGRLADMPIFNAVLVDIDGDGWSDLFLTTYREGMFVLPNRDGHFDVEALQSVPNRPDAVLALAATFGDLDRDGDLDVALGNWAAGWYRRVPGEESRNRVLFSDAGQLTAEGALDLPGIPGETLSILFSDLNNDGAPDLIVGNDFEVPDYFYLGDGEGGLSAITYQDGLIPESTTTTMSLSTADLTNDGRVSIYAAQIAGRAEGISDRLRMQPIELYCDGIERESDRAVCQANMDVKQWYRPGNSLDPSLASRCGTLDEPYRSECRGMLVKDLAIQNRNPALCDLIPVGQTRVRDYCEMHFRPIRAMTPAEQDAAIPQVLARNVLLDPIGDGAYREAAEQRGLEVGGWSWDVTIADFDNDGWQDVYVVNGTWVPNEVTPSNIFLRNQGDGVFAEETEAQGLGDYLITATANVVDIDNDGDLDVLTVPVNGPPIAFLNNQTDPQAIRFVLEDHLGNRQGIGARIELHHGADGGQFQVREIQLGGGFMSFNVPVAHFGLGEENHIERAFIRWPDGGTSVLEDGLVAGATYRVVRHLADDDRSAVE